MILGGYFVMSPQDAAYATRVMNQPKYALPVHDGTFPVLKGTPEEYMKALGNDSARVFPIKPGEQIEFGATTENPAGKYEPDLDWKMMGYRSIAFIDVSRIMTPRSPPSALLSAGEGWGMREVMRTANIVMYSGKLNKKTGTSFPFFDGLRINCPADKQESRIRRHCE